MSHIGKGASGVNYLAIADETLFPGVPAKALSIAQMAESTRLAKNLLRAAGDWPDSTAERQGRSRASDRAERSSAS
ncbi:MAG: hypothetical protein H0U66_03150 [Gemmatimonadaceae bacterium]|nr:hypothetical protein [Gemmatimonadaceae bacterium]